LLLKGKADVIAASLVRSRMCVRVSKQEREREGGKETETERVCVCVREREREKDLMTKKRPKAGTATWHPIPASLRWEVSRTNYTLSRVHT
jgi:hypothetical protein